jgi:hypothetical protein
MQEFVYFLLRVLGSIFVILFLIGAWAALKNPRTPKR